MKNTFYILAVCSTIFIKNCLAESETHIRGTFLAKGMHYTQETYEKNGQRHRAQIVHETKFTPDFNMVNQARWQYSTLYKDFTGAKSSTDKDQQEIYIGENYFKYQSNSWVLQTGYQEVAWGEAFGLNYADIVNPKDLTETYYSSYSDSRIPLFIVNYKYFIEDGSIQLIYSPEPKFSKSLPHQIFTKPFFGSLQINVKKEEGPRFFDENEWGGKVSKSFWGIDAAAFYYSYLDREAYYTLTSSSLAALNFEEHHERIQSTGLSLAKTLNDDFVLRSDVVFTQDKVINSSTGLRLTSFKSDLINYLISLDTPTYNGWSAMFMFAVSDLQTFPEGSFREDIQNFGLSKLTYDLGDDKSFDISYTHEFNKDGHIIQSQLLLPLNSRFELSLGGEFYWGKKTSSFSAYKNISNVFISFKNYFQLL